MEIVLATSNPHKVEEINAITEPYGITFILPPKEFNPIENGEDFESNSLIKAIAAYDLTHKPTLADDSGLCVNFLNGEPGIYSARYAETPQKRIDKLLHNMKDAKDRRAKFVCAMTLLDKKGNVAGIVTGECNGQIALEQKGSNGFGYDPIFVVDKTVLLWQNYPKQIKTIFLTVQMRLDRFWKLLRKILHHYSLFSVWSNTYY